MDEKMETMRQCWSAEQTVISSVSSVIKMNPLTFIKVIMGSISLCCARIHLFPALSGNALISFTMWCDKPIYYISILKKRRSKKGYHGNKGVIFPPSPLPTCNHKVKPARSLLLLHLLFDSAHPNSQCSC